MAIGMVTDSPDFKGLSLVVPCIKISPMYQVRLDKVRPLAKLINYVAPYYRINERKSGDVKPWLQ